MSDHEVLPEAVSPAIRLLHMHAPQLARDIALKIDKPSALAEHYGLTTTEWEQLRTSEHFRKMVALAIEELSQRDSRSESIRVKALYALDEVGVIELTRRITDPTAPHGAVVAYSKELREMAGVGTRAERNGEGSFSGTPLVQIIMPSTLSPIPQARIINVDPQPLPSGQES